MQEETLKLTFDLTVEVEQPIWINKHADRENYIEHYAIDIKMILTIYSIISKTLLTLVSVTQIEVTPCRKRKELCTKVKNTHYRKTKLIKCVKVR